MRRRQTETPIQFAHVRLRVILPALLGVLGAFVPALHSQVALYTVSPSADNQAGLIGTGILTSSANAANDNVGRVDQSITATYAGSLYSAAGNTSQATLKLQASVSARRAVALVPGSARMNTATTNSANRAGGGYAVAAHGGIHRTSQDPMAELSQSIGPANRQDQQAGYMQAIGYQPEPAIVYTSDLEQSGGLEKIGDGALQDGIESSTSVLGAPERLCGVGCGLTGGPKKPISVARRKQSETAMELKYEGKIQQLDQRTTVSSELKTETILP